MRETFSMWNWYLGSTLTSLVSSQIDPWSPLTLLIKLPGSSLDELKLISKLIRVGWLFSLRILYQERKVRVFQVESLQLILWICKKKKKFSCFDFHWNCKSFWLFNKKTTHDWTDWTGSKVCKKEIQWNRGASSMTSSLSYFSQSRLAASLGHF